MARRITGHSVGILAIQDGEGLDREILSFPYTIEANGQRPWASWRVPMETGENGESITATAGRAFSEEIIAEDTSFTFSFVEQNSGSISPVYYVLGRDEKSNNPEDLHLKTFFLVNFTGELRTVIYSEQGPRGLEVHGLPVYNELSKLLRLMNSIGRVRAHETAVLASVARLCGDRGMAMHYAASMSQYVEAQVSEEDVKLVSEYISAHMV
ncbi:MAG: hypothetical protein WA051_00965 [Minisyncoccia bacterium]